MEKSASSPSSVRPSRPGLAQWSFVKGTTLGFQTDASRGIDARRLLGGAHTRQDFADVGRGSTDDRHDPGYPTVFLSSPVFSSSFPIFLPAQDAIITRCDVRVTPSDGEDRFKSQDNTLRAHPPRRPCFSSSLVTHSAAIAHLFSKLSRHMMLPQAHIIRS